MNLHDFLSSNEKLYMTAFSKLFEDKKFYDSVMEEIAKEAYKNLINGK